MTTTAQTLALSAALASYVALNKAAPVEPTVQKLVKVERPKKGRKAAAPKAEAAPAEKPAAPSPNGVVPVVTLPVAGTIGAKAFIMMMNRAKDRDEKVAAIAAYVGYDGKLSFAEQEMAANAKAKGEIRPVVASGPSREEIKTAQRSAKGYVAGMPDALRKTVQDLLGREQYAVDAREAHLRDSKDENRSEAERTLALGQAQLEEERLVQIRKDLAQYV
jgi:hypothetical protein